MRTETRVSSEWITEKSEIAQWVTKLNIMEDKIKKHKANLKKFRAHLEAVKRYSVDFTNPVEWHKEMLARLPWRAKHRRAMTERQIAGNVEASKLTQRLMAVTQ